VHRSVSLEDVVEPSDSAFFHRGRAAAAGASRAAELATVEQEPSRLVGTAADMLKCCGRYGRRLIGFSARSRF